MHFVFQLRVSVYTSSKLPDELNAFKRKLGLTLIQFEDANIELRPFFRADTFETAQNVIDSISKHYQVIVLLPLLTQFVKRDWSVFL